MRTLPMMRMGYWLTLIRSMGEAPFKQPRTLLIQLLLDHWPATHLLHMTVMRSLLVTVMPDSIRSKNIRATPPRGRTLLRNQKSKVTGSSLDRREGQSPKPGASPQQPNVVTDFSSDQLITNCTPTISQETSSKRRILLPTRQSLRLQVKDGPTSVLTKAKKRAREKGEGSSTATGIIKRQIRDIVIADWMPEDIDLIPLQVWDPNGDCATDNLRMVVYCAPPEDGDDPAASVV